MLYIHNLHACSNVPTFRHRNWHFSREALCGPVSVGLVFARKLICKGCVAMAACCASLACTTPATGFSSSLGNVVPFCRRSIASVGYVSPSLRVRTCFYSESSFRGKRKMRRRGAAWQASQGQSTLEKEKVLPDGYMDEMQAFLRRDLIHLFDEQGIDKSMYDKKVEFRDPITKYDSLNGYLLNIQFLRLLFHPIFELHTVKQVSSIVSFSVSFSVEMVGQRRRKKLKIQLTRPL